ncbi:MAG: CAAX prenyl protease-related protein [Planctomycetes bacterium]|nr:CAAX prenyl protease-related protein [Planctomycetota bacterium]
MPDSTETTPSGGWRHRLDRYLALRPDWVLIAPFMAYLLLLSIQGMLPYEWRALAGAIRGAGGLVVVWLVWRHLPPLGRAHIGIAFVAGVLVAAGWVAGQHFFNWLGIAQHLPVYPGTFEAIDPREKLGVGGLFWTTVVMRIAVATVTVAIVEELFWRGFLLRAFVSWSDFEKVPLGRFTWFSFLGISLLSMFEHPDNWLVSVFCWFAYNGLLYWKKSLLCLIITHGVTNLALYIYVVASNDWIFW